MVTAALTRAQIEQYEDLFNRLETGNFGDPEREAQIKALKGAVAILGWAFVKHDGTYMLVQDGQPITTNAETPDGGRRTYLPVIEREVEWKGQTFRVADMPQEYGYRVEGSKGDYYYTTVRPHAMPTCTCRAGEVYFTGCTKVPDHVCKHVRASRVRHVQRAWPAAIGNDELCQEILDKFYWDADPLNYEGIGASFKSKGLDADPDPLDPAITPVAAL